MSYPHAPLSVDMQNCPPSPITEVNTHKKRTASRSSTPGPRWRPPPLQTGDKTPKYGLPSPPTSASTDVRLGPPQAAAQRVLQVFCNDWHHVVGPTHPNYLDGVEILGSLAVDVARIIPSNRYSYHGYSDPRSPIQLDRLTQIDLHALEIETCRLLTDQRVPRPHQPPPLTDGHAFRTALFSGEPVAFTLPSSARDGVRSAPLDVPEYIVLGHRKTVFAGLGTICFLSSSASKFTEAVLTQTVGKCLLVHFPMTPDNRPTALEYSHSEGQRLIKFRWALDQPGACIRILLPGEHVFLPPHQMCAMLCLGHRGCTYSATALSDVAFAPRGQAMDVDSGSRNLVERQSTSRHKPAASWG